MWVEKVLKPHVLKDAHDAFGQVQKSGFRCATHTRKQYRPLSTSRHAGQLSHAELILSLMKS